MGIWGKGGPGRRDSKCKGREVGVWLAPGVHPESTWFSHSFLPSLAAQEKDNAELGSKEVNQAGCPGASSD